MLKTKILKMKLIKVSLFFIIYLQYISSCSSGEKSRFKNKHKGIIVNNDSHNYSSKSNLDYQFELKYGSNKLSYKRYCRTEDNTYSLDEWIDFDSLNRLTSVHTALLNYAMICDDSINITGNLLSTLKFDEAYCLIAFNEKIVDIIKLDNKLRFNKIYKKKKCKGKEKLDVEFFTVSNNEKDSSLSSISILKSYETVNGVFCESKVKQRDLFLNEKFNYLKNYYKYW